MQSCSPEVSGYPFGDCTNRKPEGILSRKGQGALVYEYQGAPGALREARVSEDLSLADFRKVVEDLGELESAEKLSFLKEPD